MVYSFGGSSEYRIKAEPNPGVVLISKKHKKITANSYLNSLLKKKSRRR